VFKNRLQIRYKQLLTFTEYENKNYFTTNKINAYKNNLINNEKYKGDISKTSKKNISRAVDILLQSTKTKRIYNPVTEKYFYFKINFITLTIPDHNLLMNVNDIYKLCLKPILRQLKEKHPSFKYIVKLEFQNNGMPHYHITSNTFINHDIIRNLWNRKLQFYGMLEKYKADYKNYNPNSTDVHAVYKIKDIKAYLIKYISKPHTNKNNLKGTEDSNGNKLKFKVWYCSDELKGVKYFSLDSNKFNELMINEAKRLKLIKVKYLDNCSLIDSKYSSILNLIDDKQLTEYKQFLNKI